MTSCPTFIKSWYINLKLSRTERERLTHIRFKQPLLMKGLCKCGLISFFKTLAMKASSTAFAFYYKASSL